MAVTLRDTWEVKSKEHGAALKDERKGRQQAVLGFWLLSLPASVLASFPNVGNLRRGRYMLEGV